jgi:uncharacterized repeat protein (TIGR01451 family)
MKMSKSVAIIALVLTLGLAPLAAQPAFQVKDIGTSVVADLPLFPYGSARLGSVTYFTVADEIHGSELWRSDGSAAGTYLIKDLCPGSCWGASGYPVVAAGALYFSGYDGEVRTLFRTDGTAAGTAPVFPPFSALGQKGFVPFAEQGGGLLLRADNVALGQVEMWKSDGTAAGTSLIQSLGPIPTSPTLFGPLLMGRAGTTVFFSNDDGSHGRELWKTDGTASGTGLVLDIAAGGLNGVPAVPFKSGPQDLPVVSGALLFTGCEVDHGCELWRSDGTAAGTSLVKDLAPGIAYSKIDHLSPWNGEAVFLAVDGLWKSDGTTAGTVRIGPASPLGQLGELAVAGSQIFFSACSGSCSLWKSDGTASGTVPVASLSRISNAQTLTNALTAMGTQVVYWNDDGTHGLEPWVSDGTGAGTFLLADIVPGAAGSFFALQDPLILTAGSSWLIPATALDGWELWGSDGTAAGTSALQALDTQTSSVSDFNGAELLDLAGSLLFTLYPPSVSALWKSDGTGAGTLPVGQVPPARQLTRLNGKAFFLVGLDIWKSDGTNAGTGVFYHDAVNSATSLTRWGDRLYFALFGRENNQDNIQIWKSDGGSDTVQVKKIVPDSFPGESPRFATAGNHLFFTLAGTQAGDLWVSDGTDAGTVPVTVPGQTATLFAPGSLLGVGSRLFFTAHGSTELWASDGTPAGTVKLGTFRSLQEGLGMAALGGGLLFAADDGSHGLEPWTTDGTAAGTHMVADVFPGALGSAPFYLTPLLGRVYFPASDGTHGRELWVSDGTAAGTRMVADLLPGAGSSLPSRLAAIGHLLFFAATDGVHSVEPWQSDGTAAGTKRIADIAPGDLPSNPFGFTAAGPYIYFGANDGSHGSELWALPRTNLGGFLTATLTVAGQTQEGGTVTYTLTVTNIGAGPVLDNLGDEVADVLPASFTLLSATAGSGAVTLDLAGNRVAWNGALDPGAAVTITIQARVGAGTFGTSLANQATLAFDADGNGSNESSGVSDDPGRPGAADATTFSPATAALGFYTLPPCRAVDTRGGTTLAGGTARTVALAGTCGVPAGARAVAGNFTVVNPTAAGFLTVFPTGTPAPLTSTLNFSRGQTRTNNAVFALSGGKLDAKAGLLGGGQVDLVLDVVGYFQ